MIDDFQRGNAWTRALIGLRAKEIHVCGDPSAVDLVRKLAARCNDNFILKEYKRLTQLQCEENQISNFSFA